MNRVALTGRLTRDPEVRYTQGTEPMAVARYTLAVDRDHKNEDGTRTADFISCVAFGKRGEFVEKYLTKGMKIAVEGRIQTGSYTNKDNQKVYTTDVVVERHEFCESKRDAAPAAAAPQEAPSAYTDPYDYAGAVPEGFSRLTDDDIPF